MALIHSFYIEESTSAVLDNSKVVVVADYIILYIKDTLDWIETIWNGNKKSNGINYYGSTVIQAGSLYKFASILNAWEILFSLAPNQFTLQGSYLIDEGRYEKLLIDRDEATRQIGALLLLCKKAEAMKQNIIHEGI